MISVFQIYFDGKSQQRLDPYFFPYKNESKDGFFENTVMKQIYDMNPALKQGMGYIGVSSWQQQDKSHCTGKEIIDSIKKDIIHGINKDVYIYSPIQGFERNYSSNDPNLISGIIKGPDMWHSHKLWGIHPYDADVLLNSSKVLPFDLFDGKWQYCHCNYFIAKKHVFDEYCREVLIPFMNFFEREDIKKLPESESWYKHRHEGKMYPSYSFVAEGLFGSFLAHSNYTFDYIGKKRFQNRYKFIRVDGYEINNSIS